MAFAVGVPVHQWSCDTVFHWLDQSGLNPVARVFYDNRIDGSVLVNLGEKEVKELIPVMGLRLKFTQAFASLNCTKPSTSSPAVIPPTVNDVHIQAASGLGVNTISVNGKQVWTGPFMQSRGFNVMYLNPADGAVTDVTHCAADYSVSDKGNSMLAALIGRAPYGTIIIGGTFEDPTFELNKSARPALQSLGIDTYCAKFAFVAVKGRKEITLSSNFQSSDVFGVRIVGRTGDEITLTRTV